MYAINRWFRRRCSSLIPSLRRSLASAVSQISSLQNTNTKSFYSSVVDSWIRRFIFPNKQCLYATGRGFRRRCVQLLPRFHASSKQMQNHFIILLMVNETFLTFGQDKNVWMWMLVIRLYNFVSFSKIVPMSLSATSSWKNWKHFIVFLLVVGWEVLD